MAERTIEVRSEAFENEGPIPPKYTCDGEDTSPQIAWSGAPAGTKTCALIVDDPDAPGNTFVHWVYFDIPAGITSLAEGVDQVGHPAPGGTQGTNDFGKTGYGGPCPPGGTHRYFFRVYALDTELGLDPGASKSDVIHAAEEHVLAEGILMGTFAR